MKTRFLSCIAVVFFLVLTLSGQSTNYTPIYKELNVVYTLIYEFKLQDAKKTLQEIEKKYPNNSLVELTWVNLYWWDILAGDDNETNRKEYQSHIDKGLKAYDLKKFDDYTSEDQFIFMNLYAFRARMEHYNKNYFKVAGMASQYIDLIERTEGKEKVFEPFYLTNGIYKYYIEASKKHYPYLYPYLIFLPNGNEVEGIKLLNEGTRTSFNLIQTECNYFLVKLYIEMEKDASKALYYIDILLKKYPNNIFYYYLKGKAYLLAKNTEMANATALEIKKLGMANTQLSKEQQLHFYNKLLKDIED